MGGVSVPVELIDGTWPVSSVRQMTDFEASSARNVDRGEWGAGESYVVPDAPTRYSKVYGTAPTGEKGANAGMRAKPLAEKQAGAR